MPDIANFPTTQTSATQPFKHTVAEHQQFSILALDPYAYEILPWECIQALETYMNARFLDSLFMRAVLENNLLAAMNQRSPQLSLFQFSALCEFVRDFIPESARGAVARVNYHLAGGV